MQLELEEFVEEALNYFNKVTGKTLGITQTRTRLLTRIYKAKYTIDQIKYVIDNKYKEWILDYKASSNNNFDSRKYMRPETLFAFANFEKYVDEEIYICRDKSGQIINLNNTEEQREYERLKKLFNKSGGADE